jgi:hypothetical protein
VIVGQTAGAGAGVAEYYVLASGVGVIGYIASHLEPGIVGTIVHVVTA